MKPARSAPTFQLYLETPRDLGEKAQSSVGQRYGNRCLLYASATTCTRLLTPRSMQIALISLLTVERLIFSWIAISFEGTPLAVSPNPPMEGLGDSP